MAACEETAEIKRINIKEDQDEDQKHSVRSNATHCVCNKLNSREWHHCFVYGYLTVLVERRTNRVCLYVCPSSGVFYTGVLTCAYFIVLSGRNYDGMKTKQFYRQTERKKVCLYSGPLFPLCITPHPGERGPSGYLREISILEVRPGHGVQPGSSQLGGAGIGPGQAVLEVQEHLWVLLVLLHLGCGHQHGADALGQTLHLGGEH